MKLLRLLAYLSGVIGLVFGAEGSTEIAAEISKFFGFLCPVLMLALESIDPQGQRRGSLTSS